jgi:16S rRNA (cytidine1402-2'-O)-methyltransferase
MVHQREAAGLTRKEAMAEVAREAGVPRREVYAAVVGAGEGDRRRPEAAGCP